MRRNSTPNTQRIEHIKNKLRLLYADLQDTGSLIRALEITKPNEVYNLAAQSFVATSFDQPVQTGDITGLGVTRLLEAIRIVNKNIKFYQASSSEMLGKAQEVPQTEKNSFLSQEPLWNS